MSFVDVKGQREADRKCVTNKKAQTFAKAAQRYNCYFNNSNDYCRMHKLVPEYSINIFALYKHTGLI